MNTHSIWKYPVEVGEFALRMPKGAQVLDVQIQGREPVMWAIVDTAAEREVRRFRIYGTGHPYEVQRDKYIGTFQLDSGSLVFHLFEVL